MILRHDVDLSLDAALRMAELEAEAGAAATYFLMTRSEFYNLDSPSGERGDRAAARARAPRRAARRLADGRPRRPLRPRARLAQPRSRVHARAGRRPRQRDGGAVGRRLPLGLEPALAPGLPARGARGAARSSGCSCSPTRRSGLSRARRCARRCSRCSTPSASGGSSSSRRTGSTSRERR